MHPRRSPKVVQYLEPAAISRCLETVKIALERGNREEAQAAIDRAFDYRVAAPAVEFSTPVADMGLDVRTCNTLEENGIRTVGALCGTTPAELEQMPQAGPKFIERIREVMAKYNLQPRNPRAWRGREE